MGRSASNRGTSKNKVIQLSKTDTIDIVATSDLHGNLPDIPDCDLLLIAGDICPENNQKEWLSSEFKDWVQSLNAQKIVAIGGNHDKYLGKRSFKSFLGIEKVTYLEDSQTDFLGLSIWGTPWVDNLGSNWAFAGDNMANSEKFKMIPDKVDIVLSHGPIKGVGDFGMGQNLGSSSLGGQIQRVAPALFVFGHIHEGAGSVDKIGRTTFVNASYVDEKYNPVQAPISIKAYRDQSGLTIEVV